MDYNYQYNKIKTGIFGLDKLLYNGLVIPEDKNIMLLIRGDDDTEKIAFSLQLVQGLASSMSTDSNRRKIHYYSNYLEEDYLADLELDMIIASSIQKLTSIGLQNAINLESALCSFFFDIVNNKLTNNSSSDSGDLANDYSHPDKMLCDEALYYNNRTNALHLRKAYGDKLTSTENNAVFERKKNNLNEYLNDPGISIIEKLLETLFIPDEIHEKTESIDDIIHLLPPDKENLVCVNLVNRMSKRIDRNQIVRLSDALKKYRISIVVIRKDVKFPEEDADMIIDMATTNDNSCGYLLHYISIYKSRYQSTVLGVHQYKRRDIGIEVYPSLHLYCQERRYLQRALVFTHSNVISETFQQFLEKNKDDSDTFTYHDYLSQKDTISKGYFNALSPSAYKNFSIDKVMDTIFINPIKNVQGHGDSESALMKNENDFLYGNNGGITAIIGEPNTYKRYITFGSAFSSAYRKEHTLFLLLNKDDKIVRRRLQCPARHSKCKECTDTQCRQCYEYMHFMNIKLGCITAEEFMYYLFHQIEVGYGNSHIKRIIIDDLQIVEHCFPFLFEESLFIPALIDECKELGIALYIMCDKSSSLVEKLKVLADNVVCTSRDTKGNLEIMVERYSGYNSLPSKIFSGLVTDPSKLFTCYEMGSRGNRRTIFEFKSTEIGKKNRVSMSDFWNKIKS
ncbi:MAG: hypothetical protein ACI37N_10655 [Prevotella sp.]